MRRNVVIEHRAVRTVARADAATELFDKILAHGQRNARALFGAAGAVDRKQSCNGFLVEPFALIRYRHQYFSARYAGRNVDNPVLRRELDRVGNQVPVDELQHFLICSDRKMGRNVVYDRQVFMQKFVREHMRGFLEERAQQVLSALGLIAVQLLADPLQRIVEQIEHFVGIVLHLIVKRFHFLGAQRFGFEQFNYGNRRNQRCAEIMGKNRQQFVFESVIGFEFDVFLFEQPVQFGLMPHGPARLPVQHHNNHQ